MGARRRTHRCGHRGYGAHCHRCAQADRIEKWVDRDLTTSPAFDRLDDRELWRMVSAAFPGTYDPAFIKMRVGDLRTEPRPGIATSFRAELRTRLREEATRLRAIPNRIAEAA